MKSSFFFSLITITFITLVSVPESLAQEISTPGNQMVRLIYFLPRDRSPRPDRVKALRQLVKDAQQFYADEMEGHGFGRKTFTIETDITGEPLVLQVNGRSNDTHYHQDTINKVWQELRDTFGTSQRIHFVAIDISNERLDGRSCGAAKGYSEQRVKGFLMPASGHCFNLTLAAHELGHAFALEHDFRDDAYIMSYGSNRNRISKCAAEWLDAHGFFNNASAQVNRDARIQMLAPTAAPPNGIRLRFEVATVESLHQAMLYLKPTLADPANDFKLDGCHVLDAESDTIEFVTSELVDPSQDEVTLQVIDKNGGMKRQTFPINFVHLLPPPKYVSVPDANAEGPPQVESLMISSGSDQDGTPNVELTDPLVVRALDADNTGIADVEIDFSVTGGQGSFGTADAGQDVYAVTNAEGFAEVPFTPTSAGTVTVEASVGGSDPVVFTVNAGPPPAKLVKISGDTQTGKPGTRLANPFVVEVQDKDDTPMEGVSVTFRVTAGGGTLSTTTGTTGENGRTQTFLTLGRTRAVNTVSATVAGINTPVTFSTSIEAKVLVAAANRSPMYWVDSEAGTLHRLVDAKVEHLLPSVQNATGLAVDITNGILYWTEKTGERTGRIRRANLDGTNAQLVKDLTSAPLYLTVDAAGRKLYLINAWNKIQRMNLDGSGFQPNLITGLQIPKGFAVDAAGGKVYWSEQTGKSTGKIRRANLDGSEVEVIKTLTSVPQGITLDATGGKVYITNAYGKVQRMNLDGSNYQPNFITGLTVPMNVAVDAVDGKVYWMERGSLRRADLNGENVVDVVTGLGTSASLVLGTMPMDVGAPAAPAAVASLSRKNALLANYPNPFNPETWIPYQLAKPANVSISIYTAEGQLVRMLALGHQPAGVYQSRSRAAYWDGRNTLGERVASGLYFYTLTAGDYTATRRMLIRK